MLALFLIHFVKCLVNCFQRSENGFKFCSLDMKADSSLWKIMLEFEQIVSDLSSHWNQERL